MSKFHAPTVAALAAAALSSLTATRASAEAMLLIEASTGKVLHAENATHPWYPASVTKLMTAYVTLQAVKSGKLSLDSLLTVSPRAAAQAPSKMGFKPGTQVTVDNALKMLMVKSANDIAFVLAEGVGGSIEKFSAEMNTTSRRLGMTQSSWVNPNGLPAEGQISSARDLAILARALLTDFPEYEGYWHVPAIKFGKKVMRNTNSLIGRYPGADGMKTGFICASGFNLVASASRGGKKLIAVVLGSPSSAVRGAKAAGLLERGFNRNGLAWLTSSLGTVDSLAPIDAAPPDMREEMCGPHRKRPAAEEADEEPTTSAGVSSGDPNSPAAFMLSSLPPVSGKVSTLLGPMVAPSNPIVVYTGPTRGKPADTQIAAGKNKLDRKAAVAAATGTAPTPPTPAAAIAAPPAPAEKPAPVQTVVAAPAPAAAAPAARNAAPAAAPGQIAAAPNSQFGPPPGQFTRTPAQTIAETWMSFAPSATASPAPLTQAPPAPAPAAPAAAPAKPAPQLAAVPMPRPRPKQTH